MSGTGGLLHSLFIVASTFTREHFAGPGFIHPQNRVVVFITMMAPACGFSAQAANNGEPT
jgi:hypothetical protein